MKNNITVLTFDTINNYYKNVDDSNINHIYKKGYGDMLCARIINKKYFGFIIKKYGR